MDPFASIEEECGGDITKSQESLLRRAPFLGEDDGAVKDDGDSGPPSFFLSASPTDAVDVQLPMRAPDAPIRICTPPASPIATPDLAALDIRESSEAVEKIRDRNVKILNEKERLAGKMEDGTENMKSSGSVSEKDKGKSVAVEVVVKEKAFDEMSQRNNSKSSPAISAGETAKDRRKEEIPMRSSVKASPEIKGKGKSPAQEKEMPKDKGSSPAQNEEVVKGKSAEKEKSSDNKGIEPISQQAAALGGEKDQTLEKKSLSLITGDGNNALPAVGNSLQSGGRRKKVLARRRRPRGVQIANSDSEKDVLDPNEIENFRFQMKEVLKDTIPTPSTRKLPASMVDLLSAQQSIQAAATTGSLGQPSSQASTEAAAAAHRFGDKPSPQTNASAAAACSFAGELSPQADAKAAPAGNVGSQPSPLVNTRAAPTGTIAGQRSPQADTKAAHAGSSRVDLQVLPDSLRDIIKLFSGKPNRRFANTDILDIAKMKGIDFPNPPWWRPGGYDD